MGPPAKLHNPFIYKGLGLVLVPIVVRKAIEYPLLLVGPFWGMIFCAASADLYPVVSISAVAVGRTVAIVFVVHSLRNIVSNLRLNDSQLIFSTGETSSKAFLRALLKLPSPFPDHARFLQKALKMI